MSTFKPIKISYTWDRENFLKALDKSYEYQYKNSARRYIGWLFIAMAQFGVVAALKGGSFGLLMLSTILIFYWYIVKKWIVKKRAIANFEKSPLKNSKIELTVTQNGIEQEGRFIEWQDIQGVVPYDDDLYLYYLEKAFYIPSNAFKSIEEKNRFKALAKEKGRLFNE